MICGIDEAGRGPLAGPVSAAAVILGDDFPREGLRDSKKLSGKQREELGRLIRSRALAWAVAWASHREIDEINILRASLLAMKRAFQEMRKTEGAPASPLVLDPWRNPLNAELPFGRALARALPLESLRVIVDGLYTPDIAAPCEALVKADAKVPEVMAASILAKTARDEIMDHYAKLYPAYGYEKHKGYPTKAHRELVLALGPSPIQRLSFTVR